MLCFSLFCLLCLLCPPLSNQSRKSLAINHFPPNLLSAATLVTSPCLPLPATSSHIPLSISVTQFTRLIYLKHCSPLIPPGSRHTLITQNRPVESSMNSHSAIRLSPLSLCSLCRLTSQNLLTYDLCPWRDFWGISLLGERRCSCQMLGGWSVHVEAAESLVLDFLFSPWGLKPNCLQFHLQESV